MKGSNYSWIAGAVLAALFFCFTSGYLPAASVEAESVVAESMSDDDAALVNLLNEKREACGYDPLIIEYSLKPYAEDLLAEVLEGKELTEVSSDIMKSGRDYIACSATDCTALIKDVSATFKEILTYHRGYIASGWQNGSIYAVIILE